MRGAILILIGLILALIVNIIAYSVNEDYRFFVKKIKYREQPVYESGVELDDIPKVEIVQNETNSGAEDIVVQEGFTFLEALSVKRLSIPEEEALPDLTKDEEDFLEAFKQRFVLAKNISTTSLFDITTEYPDEYHEYANKHMSLYVFSTKSYEQVYKIFNVLSYELPYTINRVDNFGEESFYINLQGVYSDDIIRIVLKHQNRAFGLKIKKDSYNTVKQILSEVKVEQ